MRDKVQALYRSPEALGEIGLGELELIPFLVRQPHQREIAEPARDLHAQLHRRLRADHVEDDLGAVATGQLADPRRHVLPRVVDRHVGPQVERPVQLFRAGGRDVDQCAGVARDLERGRGHAPAHAVDQHRLAGTGRVDGREATMIDFREVARVTADVSLVEGKDDCISYDLKGGQGGRVWIDTGTADVLRLDQRLVGMVDLRLPRKVTRRPGASLFMTLERSDTSIRFGRVAFEDPDESLILPLTSTSLRIMRGSGAPRLRTVTKYADYKRFLTGGRVIRPGG